MADKFRRLTTVCSLRKNPHRVPQATLRQSWLRCFASSSRKSLRTRTLKNQKITVQTQAQLPLRKLKELATDEPSNAAIFVKAIYKFAALGCHQEVMEVSRLCKERGVCLPRKAWNVAIGACGKRRQLRSALRLLKQIKHE